MLKFIATCPQACTEPSGFVSMAEQAKRSQVVEIALATTLRDRNDVIRVPEGATGRDRTHAVHAETFLPSQAARSLESGVDCQRISGTRCASAFIPREDLIAQIAGVRSQAPLVDAEVRTERASALEQNLQVAPATKGQTVGSAPETRTSRRFTGCGQSAGWMDLLHGHEQVNGCSPDRGVAYWVPAYSVTPGCGDGYRCR